MSGGKRFQSGRRRILAQTFETTMAPHISGILEYTRECRLKQSGIHFDRPNFTEKHVSLLYLSHVLRKFCPVKTNQKGSLVVLKCINLMNRRA